MFQQQQQHNLQQNICFPCLAPTNTTTITLAAPTTITPTREI
jgi:hypothetical protein